MSITLKNIISVVIVIALCLHFSFIAMYSSPYSINSSKINFIADYYVYPYFQQHWGVFVPAPKKEYQLLVRYKTDKHWSGWENIFQKHLTAHRANIFKGNEALVLMYSRLLNYLYYSIDTNKKVFSLHEENVNLKLLKHAINQELLLRGSESRQFECIVIVKEQHLKQAFYFK